MKGKKSNIEISSESVVRLALLAIIIFVLFMGCSKLNFSSSDDKYELSFKDFVGGVNSMSSSRVAFEGVKIKTGTAIIGFAEGSDSWRCYNCHDSDPSPTRKFDKPPAPECGASACICLCREGFSFTGDKNKVGQCKSMDCKVLEKNIAAATHVLGETTTWKGGFLFTVGIEGANGLPRYNSEEIDLFVDNINKEITVCDASMKAYNEKAYSPDSGCLIIKE